MNLKASRAFKTVVDEIGEEIWSVWQTSSNFFHVHPPGQSPRTRVEFKRMFQSEINDANTASVVSGALGIPIMALSAGNKDLVGKSVMVNQSQLDKQQPNIRDFVATIE